MSSKIKQIIGLVETSPPVAIQASLEVGTNKGISKRKKPETFIDPIESSSEIEEETLKIPKIYMRIHRKKLEEEKLQKTKVTPPVAQKKILKERKPTEKRKPAKESAPFPDKKKKLDLDKTLESGKSVKDTGPLSVVELIDQITKDGILSNIQHYYGDMDDKEQRRQRNQFCYTQTYIRKIYLRLRRKYQKICIISQMLGDYLRLRKEGSEDKQVIEQAIPILQQLASECKIDQVASPSSKLKGLMEHIAKEYKTLQQVSNRQLVERYNIARKVTYDNMIMSDRDKLSEEMTRIDEALHQCSHIYWSCTNTTKLTAGLDNKVKADKDKLEHLVVTFDGTEYLTSSVDGQIFLLE